MIRVSKLIKELQELQEFEKKHGNVPVLMREDGMGGHAMFFVDGVCSNPTEIGLYDFEDIDDNEEKVKALFPDWDGDAETVYESDMKPVKCLEISTGEMLYST
jgi:hypothetical protein